MLRSLDVECLTRHFEQSVMEQIKYAITEAFLSVCTLLIQSMKAFHPGLLEIATQRLVPKFQPEQAWLYSSHARGRLNKDSDVDLLVVLRHSYKTPIRRSQRAHRCLPGLRMPKDVLAETRQEVDRVKERKTSLGNLIIAAVVDSTADARPEWKAPIIHPSHLRFRV